MKLYLLLAMLTLGFALAQSDTPTSWTALLAAVIPMLPALYKALSGGVNWYGLVHSATFWTAVSGIVASIGLFVQGDLSFIALAWAVWGALVAVFIRNALPLPQKAVKP